MTKAQNLPEESLSSILENVQFQDLLQCQVVCRSWYRPAHVLFLRDIKLNSISAIEGFIASIDNNPESVYLNAVKTIYIGSLDFTDTRPVDKEKLFYRFPNLKTVMLFYSICLLEDFNDETCKTFFKNCPNLAEFKVTGGGDNVRYYEKLYNAPLLLTSMSIPQSIFIPEFKSFQQYITRFPRLLTLKNSTPHPDNFEKCLSVFEKLQHLTSYTSYGAGQDEEYFMERYLTAKPQVEQDHLLKMLSQIEHLTWTCRGFCANGLKFIATYLTGLQYLRISCDLDKLWIDIEQRLFCNIVLDSVCSVEDCRVDMTTNLGILTDYLPLIIRKVFPQSKSNRVIKLFVTNNNDSSQYTTINVTSNKRKSERVLNIMLWNELSLQQIATCLTSKGASLEETDELILSMDDRYVILDEMDTDIYDKILGGFKSLKRLTLDVPISFKDDKSTYNIVLSQLEAVTLVATPNGKFQSLLDRLAFAFPNLKTLHLHYFCGIQTDEDFKVDLNEYSLETLTIDITPVKTKLEKSLDRQCSNKDFAIIKVQRANGGEWRFYKVFLGDLTYSKIEDVLNDGYICVHLSIEKLQRLELLVHRYSSEAEEGEDYLDTLLNCDSCIIPII